MVCYFVVTYQITFQIWTVDSVHLRCLLKTQFEEHLFAHLTTDAVPFAGSSAIVNVVCKVQPLSFSVPACGCCWHQFIAVL